MSLTVDLPDWSPVEVPAMEPAPSQAGWVPRIGTPAAVNRGLARMRRFFALAFAVFIPFGAVRLVVDSASRSGAQGAWATIDPILIVLAIIGATGVISSLIAARQHRRAAFRSALAVVREADHSVSEFDLRPALSSMARFDHWAAKRGLRPLEGDGARVASLQDEARILFAEDAGATDDQRRERFGGQLTDAFRAAGKITSVGRSLIFAPLIGGVVGGVLFLSGGKGQPVFFVTDVVPILVLVAVIVSGLVVAAVARERMRRVVGLLFEALWKTDQYATRSLALSFLRHPLLYDLWLRKRDGAL